MRPWPCGCLAIQIRLGRGVRRRSPWPRSWIITTAIVGIVAIIISARLVGQSWRKDLPPGHHPPEGVAPPSEKAGKGPHAPRQLQLRRLLQAEDLTVAQGSFCVGRDKHRGARKGRQKSEATTQDERQQEAQLMAVRVAAVGIPEACATGV